MYKIVTNAPTITVESIAHKTTNAPRNMTKIVVNEPKSPSFDQKISKISQSEIHNNTNDNANDIEIGSDERVAQSRVDVSKEAIQILLIGKLI